MEGWVDLRATLKRIKDGIKHPHKNDGSIFENAQDLLPQKAENYYREFVHPTAEAQGAGPQRIVVGESGEIFYTPDHYKTFIKVN